MFPVEILNNKSIQPIHNFIIGSMSISDFIELLYNDNNEIFDYLQKIIDYIAENNIIPKKRTVLIKNVNQNKPFELRSYVEDLILKYRRTNKMIFDSNPNYCPTVKEFLSNKSYKTAMGAFIIHGTIADIYYQINDKVERAQIYEEAYEFSLDILPSYLSGGIDAENYISQYIIAKIPKDIKGSAKKKIVKEEIKKLFKRQAKSFPRWIGSPEWPIGTSNKPMIYIKQINHKASSEHDDYSEYHFLDEDTNEIKIIRQYW